MNPFANQFKKSSQEFLSCIKKMITDGLQFCCTNKNICIEEPDTSPDAEPNDKITVYSEKDNLNKWFHNLFLEELKSKPLNPMALEQMRIKGIEPKKQPREILLIIIVASAKRIHIGISIPDNFTITTSEGITTPLIITDFIHDALNSINSYDTFISSENLAFVEYPIDSEIKEIDNVLTLFFNQLKKNSIYKNNDTDDEFVNYLDAME